MSTAGDSTLVDSSCESDIRCSPPAPRSLAAHHKLCGCCGLRPACHWRLRLSHGGRQVRQRQGDWPAQPLVRVCQPAPAHSRVIGSSKEVHVPTNTKAACSSARWGCPMWVPLSIIAQRLAYRHICPTILLPLRAVKTLDSVPPHRGTFRWSGIFACTAAGTVEVPTTTWAPHLLALLGGITQLLRRAGQVVLQQAHHLRIAPPLARRCLASASKLARATDSDSCKSQQHFPTTAGSLPQNNDRAARLQAHH